MTINFLLIMHQSRNESLLTLGRIAFRWMTVLIFLFCLFGAGCQRNNEDDPIAGGKGGVENVATAEPEPASGWEPTEENLKDSNWISEHYSILAEEQLSSLSKILTSDQEPTTQQLSEIFDPATSFSGWRQKDLKPIYQTDMLTVLGDDPESDEMEVWSNQGGTQTLDIRSALVELSSEFSNFKNRKLYFDIDKTLILKSNQFVTESTATLTGEIPGQGSRSMTMRWLIRWMPDEKKDAAKIDAFRVMRMEQVTLASQQGKLYADCTGSIVKPAELLTKQFSSGVDQWVQELGTRLINGWQGVSIADINNDGLDDFYVCQGKGLPNRLFVQRSDGTAEEAGVPAGVAFHEASSCSMFSDFDNDGDQDLLIAITNGIAIMENDGTGRFHFLQMLYDAPNTTCMAAADYDSDGDLDLLACAYLPVIRADGDFANFRTAIDATGGGGVRLFRNDGSLQFVNSPKTLGLENQRYCTSGTFQDFDGDGDFDIALANDFAGIDILENKGDWFTKLKTDEYLGKSRLYRDIKWMDIDNDGTEEVVCVTGSTALTRRTAAHYEEVKDELLLARADMNSLATPGFWFRFTDEKNIETGAEIPKTARGGATLASGIFDINGDGLSDIVTTSGGITRLDSNDAASYYWRQVLPRLGETMNLEQKIKLSREFFNCINNVRKGQSFSPALRNGVLLNVGDSRLIDLSGVSGIDRQLDTRSMAFSDWDNDGDWDIIQLNRKAPRLMISRNESAPQNYLSLQLVGSESNRDGVGAKVQVFIRGKEQPLVQNLSCRSSFLTQSSRRLIFHLQESDQVEKIRVQWPIGNAQEFTGVRLRENYVLTQGKQTAQPASRNVRASMFLPSPAPVDATTVQRSVMWPKIRMSTLQFKKNDGLYHKFVPDDRIAVIHLWSNTDQALSQNLEQLDGLKRNYRVLSLNCDPDNGGLPEKDLAELENGALTAGSIDKLKVFAMEVFADGTHFQTPCWLVVDSKGRLSSVYKQKLNLMELESDVESVAKQSDDRYSDPPGFKGMRLTQLVYPDYSRLTKQFRLKGYIGEAKLMNDYATFQVALGLCNSAQKLASKNQRKQAIDLLNQAIDIEPNCREAYLLKGKFMLSFADGNSGGDEIRQATACFERVLIIDPSNVDARLGLANIEEQKGNLSDAISIIDAAIRKNSRNPSILKQIYLLYWLKGKLEFQQGNHAEASKSLATAFDLRPIEPFLATELALVYADAGEFKAAIRFLTYGAKYFPNEVAFNRVIGVCQFIVGQDADALISLQKVANEQTRDFETRMMMAWILATSPDDSVRDGKKALEIIEPIVKIFKQNPIAFEVLAAAQAELGDFDAAKTSQLNALNQREKGVFDIEKVRPMKEMQDRFDQYYANERPIRMTNEVNRNGHPFPRIISAEDIPQRKMR